MTLAFKKKIVFIGTVDFSYRTLECLLELGANIVGVVTKQKSSLNSDFKDLTPLCDRHSIPYLFVNNVNDEPNLKWIKEKSPDLIFCFGWSQLIKKELIDLPTEGIIGFHPAELPLNRGRHPIIWALVLGLESTASTFFFIDEGADSGDIVSQKKVSISEVDDASSLYEKITQTAIQQLVEVFPSLERGGYSRIKQDATKATYWRKRSVIDGKIDFRMSSRTICNLVRALANPYPGATFSYNGESFIAWKVTKDFCDVVNIEPGKILAVDGRVMRIKTGDGAIALIDHTMGDIPCVGDYLT